jgi:hypothetical protein
MGYGYYEARAFDLASEPSWHLLAKKYPSVAEFDTERFTFELEETAIEVEKTVGSILVPNKPN